MMDLSNLQYRSSMPYFPPHKTQLHPRMHPFSSFTSPNPKPSTNTKEKWWILVAVLVISPFLFYLFAIARGIHSSSRFLEGKAKGYGIIIDAGTTGSRIHIFEFLNEGRIPFISFDGKGSVSFKSRPGLSSFLEDPTVAGSSLLGLLDFARKRIPKEQWGGTQLKLIATAGMRRVKLGKRNAILESCRRVLRSSGFLFKDEWASVITGPDEGLYAWVAANYALGTLGGDPMETTGIVELGWASTQVTFVPREPPPLEFLRTVKLAGVTYNLYSNSMLDLSQDTAWELLCGLHSSGLLTSSSSSIEGTAMGSCIPRGYIRSSNSSSDLDRSAANLLAFHLVGNFSACKSEILTLLQKGQDKCSHPPCRLGSSFMPELRGKFLTMDSFFYTSEFFGLVPRASLSQLKEAGEHFCEEGWTQLKGEHLGIDESDLLRYCFSSAYIVALLHDGLGIPMNDKRFGLANQVESAPIDWTLGAFIVQTAVEPESELESPVIFSTDSLTFFWLLAVLLLAVLAAFYISKWRKPQLRTIYDLEKGRYIVTHTSR